MSLTLVHIKCLRLGHSLLKEGLFQQNPATFVCGRYATWAISYNCCSLIHFKVY